VGGVAALAGQSAAPGCRRGGTAARPVARIGPVFEEARQLLLPIAPIHPLRDPGSRETLPGCVGARPRHSSQSTASIGSKGGEIATGHRRFRCSRSNATNTTMTARLDRGLAAPQTAEKQVIDTAVFLLCVPARMAYPDVGAIALEWSDQGPFLTVEAQLYGDGISPAQSGQIADEANSGLEP
jgi:hypothetical protein